MKGGKADKLTLPQIAKKHKVPIEDLTLQLKLGIKTEMEHTDNKSKAKEIAMDHLAENPKYYTKLKKAKLEEAIAKSLATAALGLSLMGNPSVGKSKQSTPISQQQSQKVLARVSFSRSEPLSNPDYDNVHGALGSVKFDDDFSQRVTNELVKQFNLGKKPDVSNIKINTYIEGDQIITEASCDIVESTDGIAYTEFTTRGSIGNDYERRHDEQVDGLVGRLEKKYGAAKQVDVIYINENGKKVVDKSAVITFRIDGQDVFYKQSFFVAGKSNQPQMQQSQQIQTISGKDFGDLRQKLRDQTKDISIDPNSIQIDINNFKVSYKAGTQKIKVMSFLYDDQGQLENRLANIKTQNPTLKEIVKGKTGNVEWVLSIILPDETLKEENLPKKLKADIEIEYHKSLNPKIWLNNHLKTNVRKKLLSLAKFYFNQLDLGVELKDIIFTGSLVNYNYTNLSDIDLHLIIDYSKLTDNQDFAKEFFGDKRTIWADSNEIQIYGYPVEIYVQDESEMSGKGMGAMYSILKNKWIKKPKYKLPEVDKHLITKKVNKYLDILNKISMTKNTIKKVDAYNKVFEKVKNDRRKATKEEGEFSVDNLVFKILRNKKVFDAVRENKKEIVNNVFSINSN